MDCWSVIFEMSKMRSDPPKHSSQLGFLSHLDCSTFQPAQILSPNTEDVDDFQDIPDLHEHGKQVVYF